MKTMILHVYNFITDVRNSRIYIFFENLIAGINSWH